MADKADDRSLGELISELSRETGTLVRKEIELARVEVSEKIATAGKHAGMAAVGGALAYAGLVVLLGAIVMGIIQLGLAPWLAALLVALVAMLAGYLMATSAIGQLRRTTIAPTQTLETLKENSKWATGQKA
jgi:hypothetical protein